MWCLSFIDFFSVIFALASYNFDIIIKKQTFFCELFILTILSWHGFTNSKLCSLKSNKKFTHSDLVQTLNFNKICEFSEFKIGETMPWKSSLFLFAPAPWAGTPATTSLKPWIWWNIGIIWSSSYWVSSGYQNWSWLRIVSYQSWFVTAWSPKLSKEFL